MSTTKTTVTGTLATSDNTTIVDGQIVFVLSRNALDKGENEIIVPRETRVDIQQDGTFTVDLWPNGAGVDSTSTYAVTVVSQPSNKVLKTALGSIQVPDLPSVDLRDLLAAAYVAASTKIVVVDNETEFNAAVAGPDEIVVLYE